MSPLVRMEALLRLVSRRSTARGAASLPLLADKDPFIVSAAVYVFRQDWVHASFAAARTSDAADARLRLGVLAGNAARITAMEVGGTP